MKLIILIEQTTTNLHEYTVRVRADISPSNHRKIAENFTTAEDAQEYAEVFQGGAEFAGADTMLVASEEIADELEDLTVYERSMRVFSFDSVWEKL